MTLPSPLIPKVCFCFCNFSSFMFLFFLVSGWYFFVPPRWLSYTIDTSFETRKLVSKLMIFHFFPLGLLGGLTCVLSAYLGAEAAKVLLVFPANQQRIIRWLLWSLLTVSYKPSKHYVFYIPIHFSSLQKGLTGGLLCAFRIDDGPIPMNKNLWSLSFALVTSSIAFCVLTILYVFIDVLSWWSGAPFRYAGKWNWIFQQIRHISLSNCGPLHGSAIYEFKLE